MVSLFVVDGDGKHYMLSETINVEILSDSRLSS